MSAATKRPLAVDDDAISGSSSAKSARTSEPPQAGVATSRSAAEQLARLLRTNVFPFLSTRDATVLLSACKSLWYDTELAAMVLQTGLARDYAKHFGAKCDLDWFNLNPRRCPSGCKYFAMDCDHEASRKQDAELRAQGGSAGEDSDGDASNGGEYWYKDCVLDASEEPVIDARLVSLVAAFEQFILQAHPGDRGVTMSHVSVFAIPVAIPLRSYHPNKLSLAANHDWTRDDVRVALNALRSGFGDRFVDGDPAKAYASQFGLHWDNTKLVNGKVECALCGISEYMEKWHDATRKASCGEPAAIDELRASELGQQYALCDAALQAYEEDDDEDYKVRLVHSLKQAGLVVFPLDEHDGEVDENDGKYNYEVPFTAFEVNEATTGSDGFPFLCETFGRLLKQFLLQHCKFATRMRYKWHVHDDEGNSDMTLDIIVELLAGVTPSGYLCGSFYVLNSD